MFEFMGGARNTEEEERRQCYCLMENVSPKYNITSVSVKGAAFVKDNFSNMLQDKPYQGFICVSITSDSSQQRKRGRVCVYTRI